MCDCSSSCSCSSTDLPIGATGATGDQGLFGGFSAEWVFNTSTSTGPSSTQLRFNNTTYSSVTAIYVSDTGTGSLDMDAFLDSISNNSKFGYIRVFKKSDSTKFWMGQVTAVTDNGTDHTLTVTHIQSNSTFAASDAVVLTFSPAGVGGIIVLNNDTTAVGTANAAFTTLKSYTLAANQLNTNGDIVEITSLLDSSLTAGSVDEVKRVRVRVGGTVVHTKLPYFNLFRAELYMRLVIRLTRQSATTLFVDAFVTTTNELYQHSTGYSLFETGFSVSDLSTNTTLLEIQGQNIDATPVETITANQFLVTYQNKV